jgi:hypothetical protein
MLKAQNDTWDDRALTNLESFMKLSVIPEDVRTYWALQLVALDRKEINQLLTQPAWRAYLI